MQTILSSFVDLLNRSGEVFCSFAGTMFLQIAILTAVLLVLELLLRNRVRAVVRYWLWLLVLVKLILPVGLQSPASIAYWLPTARPQTPQPAVTGTISPAPPASSERTAPLQRRPEPSIETPAATDKSL